MPTDTITFYERNFDELCKGQLQSMLNTFRKPRANSADYAKFVSKPASVDVQKRRAESSSRRPGSKNLNGAFNLYPQKLVKDYFLSFSNLKFVSTA